ncbi:MAG: hypothetical protein ABWY11_26320 [Umezawaea sp.]
MSVFPEEWPTALQEILTASRGKLPLRFRGYDRQAVDVALRETTEQWRTAVEDSEGYLELARVLDEELAEARTELARYDRLHSGEELAGIEDEATRDAVARARCEADAIVEDARQEARAVVERHEQAVAARMRSFEDEEQEARRRLAALTAMAGDIVRAAGTSCEQLLARLAGRRQLLDEWAREFSALLDVLPSFCGTVEIPRSRRPEEVGAPRARTVEAELTATETT